MVARLLNIREACALASDLRTEDNVNDILDFVKDVKFFARLSVLQQRSLCRTMSLEEFGPREFVFQMGENGDKFYIILAGSVGVQVPSTTAPCPNDIHNDKCDCPNRPLETAIFLEKGMGFGELALQSDTPRSATIQSCEKTELLVTKRTDYEMYAGQLHRLFIEQRVKFLRQCPRIEDALQRELVSTQDIAAMANCLNEVQLSGNAVACRQGDLVDHMIFVRSGQLATLRCVDLEATREASAKAKAPKPRAAIGGSKTTSKEEIQQSVIEFQSAEKAANSQPQWQLTVNLAKAMMDMKRKDRKERMDSMDEKKSKKSPEDDDDADEMPAASSDVVTHKSSSSAAGAAGDTPKARKSVQLVIETGSEAEKSPQGAKGKLLWGRIRGAVKSASCVDRFLGAESQEEEEEKEGVDAATKNIEHFSDVQAARRMYTQFTFKSKKEADKANKDTQQHRRFQRGSRVGLGSGLVKIVEPDTPKKRARILRIGTIGPYEYFGDQQVCGSEKFPVSLVSDPVAEIYVMSKHDILRRVPKKLFSALLRLEKEAVPSDIQLLEMHKQTERWNAFRRSMHGEALGNLSARNQMGGLRAGPPTGSRIDAVANLEFLGVSPHSNLGKSLLPLPQNKGVALTPKDEELFSQASARFLRRFDIMKRDPGLREALGRAGLMRNSRLHDGLPGSALDDDDQDPMAFRFDQHWYKLQKDPIGLDLDDVLSEDSSKVAAAASAPPASGLAGGSAARGSMRATRRISLLGDARNKRASAAGYDGGYGSQGSGANSMGSTFMGIEDDLMPRPPGTRGSYTGSSPAPPPAMTGSAAAKRRQSSRIVPDAIGSGSLELPPLDSTRDTFTPRGVPGSASSGRRVVGFSECT